MELIKGEFSPNKNLTALINAISARKSEVSASRRQTGVPIIDAYHGEMYYFLDPNVQYKLFEVTEALIFGEADSSCADGKLYNKAPPKILRQLAADKLFGRLRQAGLSLFRG